MGLYIHNTLNYIIPKSCFSNKKLITCTIQCTIKRDIINEMCECIRLAIKNYERTLGELFASKMFRKSAYTFSSFFSVEVQIIQVQNQIILRNYFEYLHVCLHVPDFCYNSTVLLIFIYSFSELILFFPYCVSRDFDKYFPKVISS